MSGYTAEEETTSVTFHAPGGRDVVGGPYPTCLDLTRVSVPSHLGVVLAATLDVGDAEVYQHLLDRLKEAEEGEWERKKRAEQTNKPGV